MYFSTVDWAALAKQWIQQRDHAPAPAEAPPGVTPDKPQNGHEGQTVSGNKAFI